MPATLSAFITSTWFLPERSLVELTNRDDPAATTVDATTLLNVCTQAVQWMEAAVASWDPTNYPWQNTAGANYAVNLLFTRAGRYDEADSYLRIAQQMVKGMLIPQQPRRRIAPTTAALELPDTSRFPDTFFDGYCAVSASSDDD